MQEEGSGLDDVSMMGSAGPEVCVLAAQNIALPFLTVPQRVTPEVSVSLSMRLPAFRSSIGELLSAGSRARIVTTAGPLPPRNAELPRPLEQTWISRIGLQW